MKKSSHQFGHPWAMLNGDSFLLNAIESLISQILATFKLINA